MLTPDQLPTADHVLSSLSTFSHGKFVTDPDVVSISE